MHEFSLMNDVIKSITDRLEAEGIVAPGMVEQVTLRIGALDIHSEESFAQAFYSQIDGTPLAGSRLNLVILPGHVKCEKCGTERDILIDEADGHKAMPAVPCSKCGEICFVEGGRGMEPIEIAVRDKD